MTISTSTLVPNRARFKQGFSPLQYVLLASCLTLTACQTNGEHTLSNFRLFEQPQSFVPGEDVVLPRDAKVLSEEFGVSSTLKLVVELDGQKRFAEARHLMRQVRNNQPVNSNGFRVSTNSMALLALKEGDFEAFMRLARQLDVSLSNPVRVEEPHTEVVALYRAVSGQPLPINAPPRWRILSSKYGPSKQAQLSGSRK